jgi:hypothetical protein
VVVVWATLAFLIGISVASLVVVITLGERRNDLDWSFVNRHSIIGKMIKLVLSMFVVTCGAASAYLGAVLP